MSDASDIAKSLRERLSGTTEERLGKALGELLENPLLTSAIGRAFDAREKASAAQEVAMGALNIPSAADVERLTRRLRSVSHRLEGIEDGVGRLDRAISPNPAGAADSAAILERLGSIETQLASVVARLEQLPSETTRAAARATDAHAPRSPARRASTTTAPAGKASSAKAPAGKASGAKARSRKAAAGKAARKAPVRKPR